MLRSLALLACIGAAAAGTLLWDGRFNDLNASTVLNKWSWSNEVGPYHIILCVKVPTESSYHSDSYSTDHQQSQHTLISHLHAITLQTQAVARVFKITLDSTSYWNGQTMRRTEIFRRLLLRLMWERSTIILV